MSINILFPLTKTTICSKGYWWVRVIPAILFIKMFIKYILLIWLWIVVMSQCLSGSGGSKDQENNDWTTADLNSELFIEVTSIAHSLYRNSVQMCRWYTKDTNKVYKLPLF